MGFTPEIAEGSPFTLANIPFGVISTSGSSETHCATAIGDFALDLHALSKHGVFTDGAVVNAFAQVRMAYLFLLHKTLTAGSPT